MKIISHRASIRSLIAAVLALSTSMTVFAQKITVTGTVYEPEGEPAIGAGVEVLGTSGFGVATDFDGNYTIQVEPTGTLVFSYVGCEK